MDKKQARLRRARKARAKIAELKVARLTVYRSNCHIYAQVIDPAGYKVLAAASTLESDLRQNKGGGNAKGAAEVGRRIAEKAKSLGIKTVAFDRAGYKFHGRVRQLAESAREHGLKF
ncbi:MAG TPA: 50S ribosomal protein L18 [Burkholderiales bacterium]|nr:50S ribosomal protein L18 [Burkholderiales bacterium]